MFGRRPDYDPKQDSIVRTEAGRLRARLAEYYAHEGGGDAVIIEMPRGGYIPSFRQPEAAHQGKSLSGRFGLAVALTSLVVGLAVTGWWWVSHKSAPIVIAVADAIQLLNDDRGRSNPQQRGFLGYAYARSGNRDEAEKMAAGSRYPNEQALIYSGLGDKDRIFEALERMAVLGAQRVGQYLNFPELALVRDDPRLTTFRRKVGLPDR